MIKANCVCGTELTSPGALLLGPPVITAHNVAKVDKMHLCSECWRKVKELLGL